MLHDYAIAELTRAGLLDGDEYNFMLVNAVMELIDMFVSQDHSGYSASLTLDLFTKLANFEALTPLTNDPAEWCDHGGLWQSRRNSECFSKDGGVTYYKLSTGHETIYTSDPA